MGADIHSLAEVRKDGKWLPIGSDGGISSWGTFFSKESKFLNPFDTRDYSVFGFLADVRNYSHCTPISECKGLPDDSEYLNSASPYAYDVNPMSGEPIPENERETIKRETLEMNYHSYSYLILKELLDFYYEQTFWNRHIFRATYRADGSLSGGNGAALAEEGEGKIITYREHLGETFFKDIELLKTFGNPEDVRVIFWFDN